MSVPPTLTQLGRYTILRTLGRGAMGVVYEGRDPKLERQVAIKTILKGHLLDSTLAADYSARFVREAQAVARLAHPNIVTVFDFGEQDEVAYLVMEFIRGRELAAHFEAGDFLDLPRGVRVMTELLDALAYAHERGIVHRDIKPANVMIDGGGHVKLTDFGVARLVDSNAERTMAGTMVGTPSYMSPEQVQGLAVGSRADLFAAGVILYQFLTHLRPFTGGGSFSIQKMIVHDHPAPPSSVNPAVPALFDGIVERALAKDPADRYPTATAFADDLRLALRSLPGAADSTLAPTTPPAGGAGASAQATTLPPDPDATVVRATSPPLRTATQSFARTVAAPAPAPTSAPAVTPAVPAVPAAPAASASASATSSRVAMAATAIGGVAIVGALVFAFSRPTPGPAGTGAASGQASAPAGVAQAASAAAPLPPVVRAPPPAAAASVAAPPPAAVVQLPASAPPPAVVAAPSPAMRKPPGADAPPAAPRVARDEPRKPPAAAADGGAAPATDAKTRAAATRAAISRCSDLLQRVQLGDTLSPSDLEVFQKECKR